jgi:hypothetical protein
MRVYGAGENKLGFVVSNKRLGHYININMDPLTLG